MARQKSKCARWRTLVRGHQSCAPVSVGRAAPLRSCRRSWRPAPLPRHRAPTAPQTGVRRCLDACADLHGCSPPPPVPAPVCDTPAPDAKLRRPSSSAGRSPSRRAHLLQEGQAAVLEVCRLALGKLGGLLGRLAHQGALQAARTSAACTAGVLTSCCYPGQSPGADAHRRGSVGHS